MSYGQMSQVKRWLPNHSTEQSNRKSGGWVNSARDTLKTHKSLNIFLPKGRAAEATTHKASRLVKGVECSMQACVCGVGTWGRWGKEGDSSVTKYTGWGIALSFEKWFSSSSWLFKSPNRISSEISYPVLNTYEDRIITTVFIFSTVKLILSVWTVLQFLFLLLGGFQRTGESSILWFARFYDLLLL